MPTDQIAQLLFSYQIDTHRHGLLIVIFLFVCLEIINKLDLIFPNMAVKCFLMNMNTWFKASLFFYYFIKAKKGKRKESWLCPLKRPLIFRIT